ncbi:MAG: endo-1,4-beta-xylanase, partial [Chloroflexota bacterium]
MKGALALLISIATIGLACRFIKPINPTATPNPTSSAEAATTPTPPAESLRDLAEARNLFIGAAVNVNALQKDSQYAETLGREFNMVVAENVMKFEHIHPERDRYDFSDADLLVDYAASHDMAIRGHTLVWHSQVPRWVERGDWTKEELKAILRDHILTEVGRYRGRVRAWDVVNEAIDDDGSLRET